MNKQTEIASQINQAAGIVDYKKDGVYAFFDVKEMYSKAGSSAWKTSATGQFQINVHVPGEKRDRIFRTKIKDGSFDMAGVVNAINDAVGRRKAEKDREAARNANKGAAERIRETYKLGRTYVSSYASSSNSFCAPSSVEGKVVVQLNFGSVDTEVAEKIMAFAKSLEV